MLGYISPFLYLSSFYLLFPIIFSHISQSFTYGLNFFFEKENALSFFKCRCLAMSFVALIPSDKTPSLQKSSLEFSSWTLALWQRSLKSQLSLTHFLGNLLQFLKEYYLFVQMPYVLSLKLLCICCPNPFLGFPFYCDLFPTHRSRFSSTYVVYIMHLNICVSAFCFSHWI